MRKIDDWHGMKATYEAVKECRGGTIVADMETGEVRWEDADGWNNCERTDSTVEVLSLSGEECERFLEPNLWLALGYAEGKWEASAGA